MLSDGHAGRPRTTRAAARRPTGCWRTSPKAIMERLRRAARTRRRRHNGRGIAVVKRPGRLPPAHPILVPFARTRRPPSGRSPRSAGSAAPAGRSARGRTNCVTTSRTCSAPAGRDQPRRDARLRRPPPRPPRRLALLVPLTVSPPRATTPPAPWLRALAGPGPPTTWASARAPPPSLRAARLARGRRPVLLVWPAMRLPPTTGAAPGDARGGHDTAAARREVPSAPPPRAGLAGADEVGRLGRPPPRARGGPRSSTRWSPRCSRSSEAAWRVERLPVAPGRSPSGGRRRTRPRSRQDVDRA